VIQIRGLLRPDAERAAYDNDDDRARFIPTAIRLGDESRKRLREGRWGSAWEGRRNAEAQNASAMTFYEFFCGGGMARAGLGPGWACLVANDNAGAKAPPTRPTGPRTSSSSTTSPRWLPRTCPGDADLAWASPPCQDVSLAGDRAGLGGKRSGAFWPFWRLMQALRPAPRLIVIENVCGLLTSHGGKDFDAICGALVEGGYRFGAVMIDAALFVPQSRERVFIIAVHADVRIPAELVADGPTAPFHPPMLVAACGRQRDALWVAPSDPPMRNLSFADIIESEGVRWRTQAETIDCSK
jgi:DNA (cytosine-5)-methyltransferase 1